MANSISLIPLMVNEPIFMSLDASANATVGLIWQKDPGTGQVKNQSRKQPKTSRESVGKNNQSPPWIPPDRMGNFTFNEIHSSNNNSSSTNLNLNSSSNSRTHLKQTAATATATTSNETAASTTAATASNETEATRTAVATSNETAATTTVAPTSNETAATTTAVPTQMKQQQ